MVIPPHPLRGVISHFIKIAPMVLRQPFIANGEAQEAINGLNGRSVEGRAMTVNIARPMEARPSFGGGGDRGGYRGSRY